MGAYNLGGAASGGKGLIGLGAGLIGLQKVTVEFTESPIYGKGLDGEGGKYRKGSPRTSPLLLPHHLRCRHS